VIVQNLAVRRGQWLSFLCFYVVCEMEKTASVRETRAVHSTPLKIYTEINKKCARTNDTAARNLCNERLGVLC